jgi:hypothetical protein
LGPTNANSFVDSAYLVNIIFYGLRKLADLFHVPPRNIAEEDNVTAVKGDIDGETGTESDTDSDVVVLNPRPIQYRAGRPGRSLQKPETQVGTSKMSRPVRKQVDEDNHVGCRASGLKTELEPGGEVPPLARVYRDSLGVGFDADYESATNETPSKKPQKRYETTVEEI